MDLGNLKRVIVESPFAGEVERNVHYARLCLHDCLMRGEAPFASHLLYTQESVLDDDIPEERELGIAAGLSWGSMAEKTVVYTDYGLSRGMKYGIERAEAIGRPIEYRQLFTGLRVLKLHEEQNSPALSYQGASVINLLLQSLGTMSTDDKETLLATVSGYDLELALVVLGERAPSSKKMEKFVHDLKGVYK
jgi:hypothetical protein